MLSGFALAAAPVLASLLFSSSSIASPDEASLYASLRAATVDPYDAFVIENRELQLPDLKLHLIRGTLLPLVADGRTFAAVFIGDGRAQFTPPAGVEQDQLFKFTKARALDDRFSQVLLYFSDSTVIDPLLKDLTAVHDERGSKAGRSYHRERVKHQQEVRGNNFEAQVLRDWIDGVIGFVAAEIDTTSHEVVSYRYDPRADEPIRVGHWSRRFDGFADTWCSYARAADEAPQSAIVSHYQIAVTLDGHKLGKVLVAATVRPGARARRVLEFELHPRMQLRGVVDEAGNQLQIVREPMAGKDLWSPIVVVLLKQPLQTEQTVYFDIGGDIIEDFHGGQYGIMVTNGWYPRLGYFERSTYDLTFEAEPRYAVFASATKVSEERRDGRVITTWQQAYPVSGVAFNFGDMPVAEFALPDLPPVIVLGRESGIVPGDRVREVGEGVARGIGFFSERFGPYPFPVMYATRIPYAHGQGFPGLLHLSAQTFGGGWRGVDEAFRAHEVAHQWWGHLVGWKSYRDQWLSEGFAVYSGALFAADALAEPSIMTNMLESWRNDILGHGNVAKSLGFSRFGMSRETMKYSLGSAAGPITLGIRLGSSLGPVDYRVLVYEKGAWVLHMLAMLLRDVETGSDAAFFAMMRDFVQLHRGENASTADFQAVVEAHTRSDMSWFFDLWVNGTDVPRFRYAWRPERRATQEVVQLRVRREAPKLDHLRIPILIRIELDNGTTVLRRVELDERIENLTIPVAARAKSFTFNALDSVLCQQGSEPF